MIDLLKLPESGLWLEGSLASVHLGENEALASLGWKILAMPSGGDFFFDVQAWAVYECTCCRCLDPADVPISIRSQFLGSRDPSLVAGGSHTLGTQDLDVVYVPEDALDEEALVRDQLLLQLPMQGLCKDDCLGLCFNCGKNWNKGPCGCRPERIGTPGAFARALADARLAPGT